MKLTTNYSRALAAYHKAKVNWVTDTGNMNFPDFIVILSPGYIKQLQKELHQKDNNKVWTGPHGGLLFDCPIIVTDYTVRDITFVVPF